MSKFKKDDKVVIKDEKFMGIIGTIKGICPEYYVVSDEVNDYHIHESLLEFENILDGQIDEYIEPMMSEDDYYAEMATIAYTNKLNISVNPETNRLSIPYFKVYDDGKISASKKVARLHFKDSGIEIHEHDLLCKKPWIPDNSTIKDIRNLLEQPEPGHDNVYTVWQVLCYEWNRSNNLIPANTTMKEYVSGKYDNQKYNNNTRLDKAYVPSNTKIPETWKYES